MASIVHYKTAVFLVHFFRIIGIEGQKRDINKKLKTPIIFYIDN